MLFVGLVLCPHGLLVAVVWRTDSCNARDHIRNCSFVMIRHTHQTAPDPGFKGRTGGAERGLFFLVLRWHFTVRIITIRQYLSIHTNSPLSRLPARPSPFQSRPHHPTRSSWVTRSPASA
ncbi:hypothetical protein EV126DRAFT_136352 [Verticillium dahliae]|nr:hypothetical protein EV126DRAFT_136352 [Verticillium dahliae]